MTTIAVSSHHLLWLLNSVSPHTADDDVLPQLVHVLLEVEPGRLRATATNRFTLATATVAADVPDEAIGAAALLPRAAADRTRVELNDLETHVGVILDVDERQVSFGILGDRHAYTVDGERLSMFPKWRSLVAGALRDLDGAEGATVPVGSRLLALWAPVAAGSIHDSLLLTAPNDVALSPLVLRYGDPAGGRALLGLQMPRRTTEYSTPSRAAEQWREWAARPQPVPAGA